MFEIKILNKTAADRNTGEQCIIRYRPERIIADCRAGIGDMHRPVLQEGKCRLLQAGFQCDDCIKALRCDYWQGVARPTGGDSCGVGDDDLRLVRIPAMACQYLCIVRAG